MKPESKVESDEWYAEAMKPDFPDEIALQLDRADADVDPTTTFSMEGVNELAEQFRMFLMARIVGQMDKGVMPKHLRANVTLDWAPAFAPINDPNVGPYFHIDADKGMEPLDHTRRYEWRKS